MGYRIVVDSCCELQEQYKNDDRFRFVPLTLEVGEMILDTAGVSSMYANDGGIIVTL